MPLCVKQEENDAKFIFFSRNDQEQIGMKVAKSLNPFLMTCNEWNDHVIFGIYATKAPIRIQIDFSIWQNDLKFLEFFCVVVVDWE